MSDESVVPDDPEDDASAPAEQPTADASSPKTYRQQQTKILITREKEREFWSRVLRDPIGGGILWGILMDAKAFDLPGIFAVGANGFPHPEATWFAAGRAQFGQELYQTLVRNDREAVFALHDLYDPKFAKPKPPRKKRSD